MPTLAAAAAPDAETPPLADWFGFSGIDVIPIGEGPGPMMLADIDGDGLTDIVVANNHRSRVEVLRQRADGSPDDPIDMPRDINEFPDHWRFERTLIPVADAVAAMAATDLDGNGRTDLVLGGPPGLITLLEQTEDGSFRSALRRDVRKLAANPAAFSICSFNEGESSLLSVVDGEPTIWPLDGFSIGPSTRYPAGASIIGLVPTDYDGDGMLDLAGISPDDAAPVRIWFGRRGASGIEPGPQSIFEMPPISEFEAIERSDGAGARIAVVDRNARRVVLYDLDNADVLATGDRDAAMTVYGFADPGRRHRAWAIADVDGDGLRDVLAADTKGNAISVFHQTPSGGLQAAQSFPSLSRIDGLAAIAGPDGAPGTLVVLSTDEGVVGRIPLGTDELAFPDPLPVSPGHEPVAMNAVNLNGLPHAAVISADKRDYVIDLIDLQSDDARTIDLSSLSRKPDHLEVHDVDQDGHDDIIVMTPDRPMMLLLADPETEGEFTLVEKDDMAQYGLVAAASDGNIAGMDVDQDGHDELLIATGNYIRAVRLQRSDSGSWGWRVARQFNTDDPSAELVAVTPLGDELVASDGAGDRLLIFRQDEDGDWSQSASLRTRGLTPGPLATGQFQDGEPGVLTVGEDGFALIPLAGTRRTLKEADSWKSSLDGHVPHELAIGDVNADGHADMVALDAGEQMMELFTFDPDGDLLHATGFQIYESRLFQGGESREYQPRQIAIGDVTGDGADDVVLLVHDRIVVYPQ